MANKDTKTTVNEDELRARIEAEMKDKIEAEVRAEVEAEAKAKIEAAEKAQKAAEDKVEKQIANAEKELAKQEINLKKQLKAMPKKTIHIPEDPNNPDDVVPIGWNGIIYAVPRGQDFEVPEVIYNIWKESYAKTQAVNKRIRESVKKELKIIG